MSKTIVTGTAQPPETAPVSQLASRLRDRLASAHEEASFALEILRGYDDPTAAKAFAYFRTTRNHLLQSVAELDVIQALIAANTSAAAEPAAPEGN